MPEGLAGREDKIGHERSAELRLQLLRQRQTLVLRAAEGVAVGNHAVQQYATGPNVSLLRYGERGMPKKELGQG